MTELDLNHTATKREIFSRSISDRIDAVAPLPARLATLQEIATQPLPETEERPGRSVSASAVGDECARRVQLGIWPTFHPEQPAPRKLPLSDKTKAVFARGHATEEKMAEWMKTAGFDLVTHHIEDGSVIERQFGFITANGQIKGFADGLLRNFFDTDSPRLSEIIAAMVLWENKTINAKNFRAVSKHGVLKQYPKYDTQVQLLMAYLEISATLFSFLNAETGELWFELTPFDATRAQAASDRAVWILQATRAGDLLPKVSNDPSYFACRFCDFREECWLS